jgi:hypothetical protein
MTEATIGRDPLDPDWHVEFVKAALMEAGFPAPLDVWHEDGALYAESCGDCACTEPDWRAGNCGPTSAAIDAAFELLNITVTRLVAAQNGSNPD